MVQQQPLSPYQQAVAPTTRQNSAPQYQQFSYAPPPTQYYSYPPPNQ